MSPRKLKPFTPIVRRRLRRVRDFILAHPEQFGMEEFVAASREAMRRHEGRANYQNLRMVADCGTTCCIAGWYYATVPKSERCGNAGREFRMALGGDYILSENVMFSYRWPEPFNTDFLKAKTAKQEAEIAARRIDHLLETGE